MIAVFVVLLTIVLEHYLQGPLRVLEIWRTQSWGQAYFQWGESAWPRSVVWAPETVLWLLPGLVLSGVLLIFHVPVIRLPLEIAVLFFCLQPIPQEIHIPRGQYVADFMGQIFWRVLMHRYAVLFWFAILGPFGALTYYLCMQRTIADTESEVCAKIHPWLVWLPAQVTGFIFALVGSFNDAWQVWITRHVVGSSAVFLRDTGLAALRGQAEDAAQGVSDLILRAGVAWIVLILLWLGVWA